jgi:hypothetical protein
MTTVAVMDSLWSGRGYTTDILVTFSSYSEVLVWYTLTIFRLYTGYFFFYHKDYCNALLAQAVITV